MTTISYTVYGPDAPQNGFDALASEWNALLQKTRFNSFFLTHEWQTVWWQYLGTGELWILAFYEQGLAINVESEAMPKAASKTNEQESNESDKKLVGIAPLYSVTRTDSTQAYSTQNNQAKIILTLIGCTEVSDYLDLIIESGKEEQVYRAFASWLHSEDAPKWHRLDLCNLPEDSQTYVRLPQILAQASSHNPRIQALGIDISQEDVAPYFVLPATFEDYLQNLLDKKQRHEIRRKQRRMEREVNCEFYIVGQEKLLRKEQSLEKAIYADEVGSFDRDIDEFLRLQRASREDKAEFMTEEMARFFRNMAGFMQDMGHLRLFFLRANGVNVAALMAFEYDGRIWLHNSGYDPSSYSPLSPGWVLLSLTIQYSIAAGVKVYDFMQGDEGYKYLFGGQDYKVMRVIVRC